jgi:peptide/nickel transport system permease protein
MISDGVQVITASPHLVLVPGLTLILAVLGINVFGEGVRDALDPRSTIGTRR